MKATTHLAFAGLTGVIATGFNAELSLASGAALAVGSLLPDIDSPQSFVGSLIKNQSKWLERKFGHRTLTHSLLGLLLLAIGSSFLIPLSLKVWMWLLIGYTTHLLLDTANVMGVPLLWPNRLQFWLIHNRAWRVPYGSDKENIWLISFIISALALTPLAFDGFSPWFHRFLGTTYGAVEDYLRWHEEYEVYVDIKGVNLLTGEQVKDRYKAIDTLSKERLLVEDDQGNAFEVSQGNTAQLWPRRITTWRGEAITTSITKLKLVQQPIGDLFSSLPAATNTYITAKLELDEQINLAPELGKFERIKVSGNNYTLRAAKPADLYKLRHLFIERGSVVIRTESNLSNSQSNELILEPTGRIQVIEIELPSLEYLLVQEGSLIQEEQILAQLSKSLEVTKAENDLTTAQAKLQSLHTELEFEESKHKQAIEQLNSELINQQQELERLDYLVAQHAVTKLEFEQATQSIQELQRDLNSEQANWQHREMDLQYDLQAAQFDYEELGLKLQEEYKTLAITTPITGEIISLRTKNHTTDGLIIILKIRAEE